MTKTILVTDLKEINHVKVSCKKCGFAIILPLDVKHIKTIGCTKCEVQFPVDKIKTWLEITYDLKKALTTNTSFADAVVEIKLKKNKKHNKSLEPTQKHGGSVQTFDDKRIETFNQWRKK